MSDDERPGKRRRGEDSVSILDQPLSAGRDGGGGRGGDRGGYGKGGGGGKGYGGGKGGGYGYGGGKGGGKGGGGGNYGYGGGKGGGYGYGKGGGGGGYGKGGGGGGYGRYGKGGGGGGYGKGGGGGGGGGGGYGKGGGKGGGGGWGGGNRGTKRRREEPQRPAAVAKPVDPMKQLLIVFGDPAAAVAEGGDAQPWQVKEGQDAAAFEEETLMNMGQLAAVLEHDVAGGNGAKLIDYLLECVAALPAKTPVYGTLVGLLNAKDAAFGEDLLGAAAARLRAALGELPVRGAALRVRLLLRFLGCLANSRAVQPASLCALLAGLLAAAAAALAPGAPASSADVVVSVPARAADALAHAVLSALPWCADVLAERCAAGLGEVFEAAAAFMAARRAFDGGATRCFPLVAAGRSGEAAGEEGEEGEEKEGSDVLDALWSHLQSARPSGPFGDAALILRTHAVESIAEQLEAGGADAAHPVVLPPAAEPTAAAAAAAAAAADGGGSAPARWRTALPCPLEIFAIAPGDGGKPLPASAVAIASLPWLDRMLWQERAGDMIESFADEHELCAQHLWRAAALLPLGEHVSRELLVLDGVLAWAMQLPLRCPGVAVPAGGGGVLNDDEGGTAGDLARRMRQVHAVLRDLMEASPRFGGAFAGVVNLFYRRAGALDAGAHDRLVDLLAFFLADFEFNWPWARFSAAAGGAAGTAAGGAVGGGADAAPDAQRRFVSALLAKCLRQTYHSKLEAALPEELRPLLPPQPQPYCKYLDEDMVASEAAPRAAIVGNTLVKELVALLRDTAPAEDVTAWVQGALAANADDEAGRAATAAGGAAKGFGPAFVVEVVMHALLHVGEMSYAKLFENVARYKAALAAVRAVPGAQQVMVAMVVEVWASAPNVVEAVVDKFMRANLVGADAVVRWALDPAADAAADREQLAGRLRWDLVRGALAVQLAAATEFSLMSDDDLAASPAPGGALISLILEVRRALSPEGNARLCLTRARLRARLRARRLRASVLTLLRSIPACLALPARPPARPSAPEQRAAAVLATAPADAPWAQHVRARITELGHQFNDNVAQWLASPAAAQADAKVVALLT